MSTTTNLKLFKHDNPTTNTNQFDVEKALNENWDKLDANAGEVASKIQTLENTTNAKDTSQDTEIKVLKAENALLKSQIPSATVVAETIHLEDSSNMQCKIMPLGASKQETREGYNLLNTENLTDQTINGVTLTRNEDGSFTLNGTSTNSQGFNVAITNPETLKANTTYTLKTITKGTASSTSNSQIAIRQDENTNLINVNFSGTSRTYTPTADTSVNYLRIYIDTGVTFTNFTVYPLLYEGTENKPYEQYGASPSIEYESPIESVGDNINLFDKDNANIEKVLLGDSGTFASSSTAKTIIHKTNPNKIYTISKIQSAYFRVAEFENNPTIGDECKNRIKSDSATSITYTTSDIGNYIAITYYTTADTLTEQEILDSIKICEGISKGTYSPHGQGSIEIYNCNENLLNQSIIPEIISNGLTTTNNKNGSFTISGTSTSNYANLTKRITQKFKEGVYTFSIDKILSTDIILRFYNEDTSTYISVTIPKGSKSISFTLEKDVNTFGIIIPTISGTTYNFTIYPMIHIGTKEQEYVAHKSQIRALYTQQPFRAIGDIKDRFVKLNGVWYEEHKIARYIFTGKENWLYYADSRWKFRVQISYILPFTNGQTEIPKTILSNYFSVTEWTNTENDDKITGMKDINNVLSFGYNKVSSLEDWKNLLEKLYNEGTPLYVDYVLATPVLIECTSEQVEVLESFNTYKNTTNISSDSIGELEVTYSKDLETLYNNLSQAVLGGN